MRARAHLLTCTHNPRKPPPTPPRAGNVSQLAVLEAKAARALGDGAGGVQVHLQAGPALEREARVWSALRTVRGMVEASRAGRHDAVVEAAAKLEFVPLEAARCAAWDGRGGRRSIRLHRLGGCGLGKVGREVQHVCDNAGCGWR